MRWLAYVHPAAMVGVLALGIWVLREGLRSRRARLLGRAFDRRPHRRMARVFLALILVGFGSGLASMGLLRSNPVFESVHSLLAIGAATSLLLGGALGFRLERGVDPRVRRAHALCGALGLLLAITAGIAAFAILP